ncbi:MAG: Uma2 family endonuclease [Acidobacteriota bacterium]
MLDPSELAPERIRPLSRREYDRMVDLGMFEDEHVELLRGMLVEMSPQGGRHGTVCAWLAQRLSIALGMSLEVRPQLPFAADDWSEPEPDVAVARRDHSIDEHPGAALLLIEVSQTSLRKDRGVKLQIYAQAGVPEYWIVDLTTMTVEVYSQPTAHGYANVARLGDGDVLRPTQLPGVELPVAELPR